MNAFLLAIAAAFAVAALSFGVLSQFQESSVVAFTANESVRVGSGGHNLLVGERRAHVRGEEEAAP